MAFSPQASRHTSARVHVQAAGARVERELALSALVLRQRTRSAFVVLVHIVLAYIVMAYIVMAYTVMAYIVMAYIVMAYVVMVYIVMAYLLSRSPASMQL